MGNQNSANWIEISTGVPSKCCIKLTILKRQNFVASLCSIFTSSYQTVKRITEKQVESLLTSKLTNLKSSSVIDLSGVTCYSLFGKLSFDATSSPVPRENDHFLLPVPMTSGFPQGSILDPMLNVNSLPDTVRSSQIAAFAMIQRYVSKEITWTSDVAQL